MATLKITRSLPKSLNYALKDSIVTAFLETLPEISSKLNAPPSTVGAAGVSPSHCGIDSQHRAYTFRVGTTPAPSLPASILPLLV
jgi:hypothetical protein